MNEPRSRLSALLLALAVLSAATAAVAQAPERAVRLADPESENLYLVGTRVALDSVVEGDVNASGGSVRIDADVANDVGALGGFVSIGGRVGDDVRVGGGRVDVDALIGGDLVAGAYRVAVRPEAAVAGNALITGTEVSLAGRVAGDVTLNADSARIGGDIGGDLEVDAEELAILSGARVAGDLIYRGAEASIAPDAVIGGEIVRHLRDSRAFEDSSVVTLISESIGVGWLIGLVVAGALLLLAFPESLAGATRNIQEAAWRSFSYGLLILLAAPVVILLCVVVVIGIPLAFVLGAAYAASLFVAYLTAAFWIGDHGLRLVGRVDPRHRGWRIVSLVGALVALSVLGWIPLVGWLVTLLALSLGLGGWALQMFQARATGPR